MKQFFYTIIEEKESENPPIGSFNLDCVVRSVEYDKGKLVVLLNDFHSVKQEKVVPVGKNGKTEIRKETEVVSSNIYLNEEDTQRFIKLTSVSMPEVKETAF